MGLVTDVKNLADDDDFRAAHTLFRAAVHQKPADDKVWEFSRTTYPPGRIFGGYVDGRLAGTTMSFAMPVTVPGGATLSSAAVTRVGVRSDHRRRGVVSALMREQLAAVAADGEHLAVLRASEYPIYGRFGYGVATRGVSVRVDPRRVAFHPGAPAVGEIRLVDKADLRSVIPEVYERCGRRRPGMFGRTDEWWNMNLNHPADEQHKVGAVHTGPDGDNGYVVYTPEENITLEDPFGTALQVQDMHAASPAVAAALWRFVFGVDLLNQVRAWQRPLDEPLQLLLADPRLARELVVDDELWVRLVDVPAVLAARSWAGSDAVVLGVRDAVLPGNSGAYRISPDGVSRVDEAPQLECDVAVLARLYLGDLTPSELAVAGWLTAADPSALPAADALFRTDVAPWCGTFF